MAHQPIVVEFTVIPFDYIRLSWSGKSVWFGIRGKLGNLEICDHRREVVELVNQTSSSYAHQPDVLTSEDFWLHDYETLCSLIRAKAKVQSEAGGKLHLYDAGDMLPNAYMHEISYGPTSRYDIEIVYDHALLSWFSNNWETRLHEHVKWIYLTTNSQTIGVQKEFYSGNAPLALSRQVRWELYSSTVTTAYTMPEWVWNM